MTTLYQIFELVEVEQRVTFAGYSDGYGRETESYFGFLRPNWAAYSYESEEDAKIHLGSHGDSNKNYEIKKIFRKERF